MSWLTAELFCRLSWGGFHGLALDNAAPPPVRYRADSGFKWCHQGETAALGSSTSPVVILKSSPTIESRSDPTNFILTTVHSYAWRPQLWCGIQNVLAIVNKWWYHTSTLKVILIVIKYLIQYPSCDWEHSNVCHHWTANSIKCTCSQFIWVVAAAADVGKSYIH